MTNIVGTIKDSKSTPLSGILRIQANYLIPDVRTTPNSLVLAEPANIQIVNGVVNLDLTPSDFSRVTYNFKFYAGSNQTAEPLFDFNASVPEVNQLQFNDLLPTDLTVDLLDTGRYAIARILTKDPNFSRVLRMRPSYLGEYDSQTIYKLDDLVVYDGSTFIYKNLTSSFDKAPPSFPSTSNNYWHLIGRRGNTGTGTLGNSEPYGVVWADQLDAPSRKVVYQKMEQLAPKVSPALQGTPTTPPLDITKTPADNAIVNYKYANQRWNNASFVFIRFEGGQVCNGHGFWQTVGFNKIITDEANACDITKGSYKAPYTGVYMICANTEIVGFHDSKDYDMVSVRARLYVTEPSGNAIYFSLPGTFNKQGEGLRRCTVGGSTVFRMIKDTEVNMQVEIYYKGGTTARDMFFVGEQSGTYRTYMSGTCLNRKVT